MHKTYLFIGSILAALAIMLGAFGAHALKKMVPAETVASFQTGVQYQMYHAFALMITSLLFEKNKSRWINWAAFSFLAGILFFSGSLYLLTFLKATETVGLVGIGMITPVGGLFFITGWILLSIGVLKKN